MYQIDTHDKVVELRDLPQMDPAAPLPALVANEQYVDLIYLIVEQDPDWDGTTSTMVTTDTERGQVACIRFDRVWSHSWGAPGDETLVSHPLAARGLTYYSVFEVLNSSWVRLLERMNSVHPRHSPSFFDSARHFIFTFHDSTFECVADSYEARVARGSIASVAATLPSTWR
ncbi:hypothetical protein [Denitrobaculum tricleocarpae]|uniref:Uncharacterized protein n=1 Tax=Denitrobaculum tricleocarpae TaxID=2591009 RepID=A0A545TY51_9PROT|nr:hypothetical protein [Denitrobaculum tricleocarpae]TQV82148.1 hypothetical protein FKG95_07965 [Denitrobaculum tricleocarpae]